MKKILLMCLFFLTVTLANAQITLGSGTTKGPAPVSTYYGYSYVQQIFPKSEINANAAGNITGLKFYLSSSATVASSDSWIVYLGHTSKTEFSSTSDWVPLANLSKVFEGTITNNSGVIEVTFTTPFPYNNVDNLVVAAEENKPGYDSNSYAEAMYIYASTSNSALYYRDDDIDPDPAGTLPAGTRYGNKSIVTFLGLTPNAIPACPGVTAPANSATGVSVTPTITWGTISNATGYRLSVGTTAGGTDVLNNTDIGNVTTYTFSTPLLYGKQYYYTVSSYNTNGSSSGCSERSFTTRNISCPTVTAPTAAASGVSVTPTITWDAVTDATGYKLRVGTTAGGTDILNNVDLGNVTSYTFTTNLQNSTKYYYTVDAYNSYNSSASCSERNFMTVCSIATDFTENFDTTTTYYLPGCWTNLGTSDGAYVQASTAMSAPNNLYIYTDTYWGYTGAVAMTPVSTLQTGNYRLKFNGRGNYSAGGVIGVGYLDTTNNYVELTTYTTTSASTVDNFTFNIPVLPAGVTQLVLKNLGTPAYSVMLDNIVYELQPSCLEPTGLTVSNLTATGADLSWSAPTTAPANGYDVYFSASSTAPTATTTPNYTNVTSTSQTLSGVPVGGAYAWVRSVCTTTSASSWTGPVLIALPTANDICSNAVALTPGATFDHHPLVGTTIGSTNPDGLTASCLFTPTNVAGNVWYKVVVPASGSLTIQTKSVSGSALTDTVISVFGDCTSTTSIACNDDYGSDNFSLIPLTGQTPGATLYVSVWRFSSGGSGTDGQFRISAFDSSILATSEANKSENTIKVYPNPFTEVLNISDITNVKSVSVMDVAGRLVKTIEKPSTSLQLGELKSGMYLVVLNMKDGSKQTIKTIKK